MQAGERYWALIERARTLFAAYWCVTEVSNRDERQARLDEVRTGADSSAPFESLDEEFYDLLATEGGGVGRFVGDRRESTLSGIPSPSATRHRNRCIDVEPHNSSD